jgi:hypothetical protein
MMNGGDWLRIRKRERIEKERGERERGKRKRNEQCIVRGCREYPIGNSRNAICKIYGKKEEKW